MPRFQSCLIFQTLPFLAMILASGPAAARAEPAAGAMSKYDTFKVAVEEWAATHTGQLSTERNYSIGRTTGAMASAQLGGVSAAQPVVVFTGNLDAFEPDPVDAAPQTDASDDELLRLAQTMGLLRAQLSAWGYPQTVYESAVRSFEAEAVQQLEAGGPNPINSPTAMAELIGDIDAVRASATPALPALAYAAQANAVFVRPVILRSAPPGGRVWVITQLRFNVCKHKVRDPYDLGGCPQWREADPRNPIYLGGTYAFQINWSDGRNARGQRTIYNDRSDAPIVYVLP